MRIRTYKPEFFTDPDVCDLSFAARIALLGLISVADREGRLLDRPRHLKKLIFPDQAVDIDALLSELDAPHFIVRYVVGGTKLMLVRTFKKNQRVHPREPESVLPGPKEPRQGSASAVPGQNNGRDQSRKAAAKKAPGSARPARKGRGKGRGKGEKKPATTSAREGLGDTSDREKEM
jgi:hypothetical protein